MKRSIGVIGALTLGVGVALTAPTAASADEPTVASGTLYPSEDFDPLFSDTRANGHYAVVGTGLHVYTDGATDVGTDGKNSDKVAEYVTTSTPLAAVGAPSLELTHTGGDIAPGYQLVVDLDADGTADGILVGETVYNGNWWLSAPEDTIGTNGAPNVGEGYGSPYFGTLEEWQGAFSTANVVAFGFSLGSGVQGDWTIDAITFADTRYTFANPPAPVVLGAKEDCKNGGWAFSTQPVFKNQGECVSSFASTKSKLANFKR